jgi:hypothetical protein
LGSKMKTRVLDGEQLLREFDGYLLKDGWESEGTCYISNLRLVFEEPDREGVPEVEIDWGKVVAGGILFGALGAGIAAAKGSRGEHSLIEGTVHILWFDKMARIDTARMEVAATLQDQENRPERFLIKIKKTEEELTVEEQERLKTLVENARDKARLQRERESKTQEKLTFLKGLCARKGFLNPESKVEYDIAKKMDCGKTREEAIDELHKEVTDSAGR